MRQGDNGYLRSDAASRLTSKTRENETITQAGWLLSPTTGGSSKQSCAPHHVGPDRKLFRGGRGAFEKAARATATKDSVKVSRLGQARGQPSRLCHSCFICLHHLAHRQGQGKQKSVVIMSDNGWKRV